MITKNLLVAALSVAALGVGSASLAAPADGSLPGPGSAVPPSMMAGPMADKAEGRGPMGPGMMGGGAMAGGGMMGACQGMMGAGLDSATAMRMHGEMMRAMGDILVKYAGKAEPAANR